MRIRSKDHAPTFDFINYSNTNSDLPPNQDPEEIFRAVQEGKVTQPDQVQQVAACRVR